MISLDKNILNTDSIVARRMVEYGKKDELFIIIPDKEKNIFDLSLTVHVQSTGGYKIQRLFRLIKLGSKIVKEYDGIELITTQDPFFTGLAGWCLKRKFKIKLEVQMHGDFLGDYYKKQWIRLSLAKFIIRRAEVIRVAGERIKKSLVKLGVREDKIFVKPIAVDTEKIKDYLPKIDLHQKYPGYAKIFLVLGRPDPVKNIEWLVEIFKEVTKQKNYLLLIVGGGRDEINIQYPISNIQLEPWTTDPISYLKTADCLLFPSLSEGYGLVAMEANAAGCPVIMNDVGVANYELKPSERVKIIPVSDREAWIKAMLDV
ncbi:MAG: hypothetical protein A2921_04090 [Candidatus Magasanikbacteria bacterium RIFCSPLOWO2_01_FULL_43_20b]|uniref:Glycosyltransferase subfamily 4-like N-terminal domain-containing protein n=1 Tax=Candidatus Magasanikbacteria bacterium RIFCSPLOWO2_12_FULL_43_12 TaxID=1798692 RepID=A0A1F6MV14_9BACT|nr:MAG: hypothetical protein A3C74_03070 [Candidatus Magasanikbacteria bacterium RIFCSPHIGHO2_02_FULL_44_13]OGH72770.1 MAG: hypothetical protein A3I93_00830 [Candidatus Magasanikbacteria bacterium RIFCSPLOWO2_02_FULL_43_22]OGH73253.1 MAG: hypothetical protein A2921_04090 [Candidatus Magasanikbacteria bacterium RIFCSPLOWO2_01_FULL_43_20b]OGH75525.1 MAG: hypothetical protein A3G00_00480 [Candidatus Magasanikbacteria bacterium RIFCSPLOWO2_12_FULL_43_12]